MKFLILFYVLLVDNILIYSQTENTFQFTFNEKNNISYKIDTINFSEFRINSKPLPIPDITKNPSADSIYKFYRNKFPRAFKDSASCTILLGKKDHQVVCDIRDTAIDEKLWEGYEISDYKKGFLLFHRMYYEWEDYILFDPQNRLIKSVWGYPNFIDSSAIFAVSNDESLNFYFIYQSLINDGFFYFHADQWMITNYFKSKNDFYFEFTLLWGKELKKYIKLSFPNI